MLKKLAFYLCCTKNWGIIYNKPILDNGLPKYIPDTIPFDSTLPSFSTHTSGCYLTGYIDVAYGNDLC